MPFQSCSEVSHTSLFSNISPTLNFSSKLEMPGVVPGHFFDYHLRSGQLEMGINAFKIILHPHSLH